MKVLKTIAIIGLSASIMSCTSSKKGQTPVSLTGEWDIVSVEGKAVQDADERTAPYIGFSLDNKIYGSSGCNRMMGSYTADTVNASLEFGQIAGTRMMCMDMTTEQAVLAALEKVKGYKVENGCDNNSTPCSLTLVDGDDKPLMTIVKKELENSLSQLNGTWNISTVNGEAVQLSTGEPLFIEFDTEQMRVSGKVGDNRFMGALNQKEGEDLSISFGQTASTMMAGPNMELEDEMTKILGQIVSFKLLSESQLALLNAEGKQVIILNKK